MDKLEAIEYRGKDLHGEWRYGFLWKHKLRRSEVWVIGPGTTGSSQNCLPVIEETIGQFTGVYAQEWEKIFSGQTLKHSRGFIGVVEYSTQGACWIVRSEEDRIMELKDSAMHGESRGIMLMSWKILIQ